MKYFSQIILSDFAYVSFFPSLVLCVLNTCSSVEMLSHSFSSLVSHQQITAADETLRGFVFFFSFVVLFPTPEPLFMLLSNFSPCVITTFPFFILFLSACQALGLYCKYIYIQCHCLIVPKCPFFLVFPHLFFYVTSVFQVLCKNVYCVYTSFDTTFYIAKPIK